MATGGFLRLLSALGVVLALAGCQMGGSKAPASDVAPPAALQGPAVEVTPLAPIGAAPAPGNEAAVKPATPAPVSKPEPEAEPALVAKPKSAAHLACEKKGGKYVPLGKSGALTCQMPTRDGGKQCRKESDCEGVCLARSRTCAPVKPLFGCQSILQEDGVQVDLCID